MAKAKTPRGRRNSASQTAAAQGAATVSVDAPSPKKKTSIPQFFSEVRAEARKITWPSRKETWITSVMVFIMVVIAAIFFWIVDFFLGYASNIILSFGG
ncbi:MULTISPECIES: preprotein translocase subunit SecE [unclassified Brevundimonas]|uniref:preprotein translocase subunit SecE n=1 Tax=unclassified Brevundimonas TaxID=2622653 RepID=UPI0025BA2578|nr:MULTISPECIES: preprotein translocase subunit SecE [unclassified Brevundimonas]